MGDYGRIPLAVSVANFHVQLTAKMGSSISGAVYCASIFPCLVNYMLVPELAPSYTF